jgi:phage terminase large subunit GpA-like protein
MTAADTVYNWIADAAYTAPPMDCWQWNTTHGRLSSRDSALPGPWRGGVVPHMRHWQDLVSARRLGRAFMGERDQYAHLTEQIWLVAGTQSTKTRSMLYAALGYLVDQWPSPKALVLPRLKDFKKVLDNRVRPFFEETPTLVRHFPRTAQALKQSITYSAWTMDTGTLYHLCGELADDLRSFPICDLLLDEFDLLPLDCEGQGDPIELILDRQKTWPRQKLALGVTTPTGVDGHGWRRLCSGSHERLFIRCPTCSVEQELHPDQLRCPKDAKPDAIKVHKLATWACARCGSEIKDDGTKDRLVAEASAAHLFVPGEWAVSEKYPLGHWTPHADFDASHRIKRIHAAETTVRSGHYNSLYSQFITLSDFAAHEMAAKTKGNASEWTAHLNGWRCEPFMPQATAPITVEQMAKSVVGNYGRGTAPVGALRLVLTLDQQGNSRDSCWFPWVARAFGPEGKSWQVDCGQEKGWAALDKLCARGFTVGAETLAADAIAMDSSNGNVRVAVQEWAAKEPARRILLRGYQIMDQPFRRRTSESRGKKVIAGVVQYYFFSTAYKNQLNDLIRAHEDECRWHLPADVPQFFTDSLTSEEQVLQRVRVPNLGWQEMLVWQPRAMYTQQGNMTVRADNHWWDAETMALVTADINGWGAMPESTPDTPTPDDNKRDSWDSAV